MERILCICMGIGIYTMSCIEAVPWVKTDCMKTPDSCDCSGLALQFVPDDIPDSIKTLDFSFNYLPTLYNSTFQRLTSLVSLDLTRCSINFIYEGVFQHQLDLENLILVANPLHFISDRAFLGPLSLKYISLAGSTIRSLMDIPASHLELLETLDLRGSNIYSLDGLENLPLQQMKRLVLDLNLIEMIKMEDMKKVRGTSGLEISFRGNGLVDVEANAFQNVDVSSLDFTGCFNKMNVSTLLKGLEGVKTEKLYLGVFEDSAKSYIQQADLQSFCNISVLDVNFQIQHLRDLTNTSFQCFTEIQKIDFTRAHLVAFPSTISSNMSMLSHLVLDNNAFTNICNIYAKNFPMLTHLSMNGNLRFLNFTENCLEPLSKLEELHLSLSNLRTGDSCCNRQLTGLRELKYLNLSYNFLMKWEPLPFNSTPNLKHLDCAYTKYVLNSSSPFSNLENLETLDLSFTHLNLPDYPHILQGLSKLQVLNLKGNTIKGGVLSKTKNFEYVPLLKNLALSACGITEISENAFENLARLKNVDLSENQLVKLSLIDFPSLNQIQLNFASNKISLVEVETFNDLGTGSSIDLSSNPLACNCTNYPFIMWAKDNVKKMKHFDKTVCDATNEKVIDVELQCVFSNRAVGIVLGIAIPIVIIISLWCFAKKYWTQYRNYSRL